MTTFASTGPDAPPEPVDERWGAPTSDPNEIGVIGALERHAGASDAKLMASPSKRLPEPFDGSAEPFEGSPVLLAGLVSGSAWGWIRPSLSCSMSGAPLNPSTRPIPPGGITLPLPPSL